MTNLKASYSCYNSLQTFPSFDITIVFLTKLVCISSQPLVQNSLLCPYHRPKKKKKSKRKFCMTDKAILNCFNTLLYNYSFQNKLCSYPTGNQIISQPGIHSCCSLCLRCLLPSLSSSTLQTLFNFQVSAKMALLGVLFGGLYLH